MKIRGYISNIMAQQRYYQIATDDGQTVTLYFEELKGTRLFRGDVLEFETITTQKFGTCAIKPVKLFNKWLADLESKDKAEPITAYVFGKNKGGYEVSYNGYYCFLPFILCNYQDVMMDTDKDLLNGSHEFYISGIKGSSVILTRIKVLKQKYHAEIVKETAQIKVGMQYTGKVQSVMGYGLFITNKYSSGLLHLSQIENYEDRPDNKISKEKREAILNEIFTIGREVAVEVFLINEKGYNLTWDKTKEPNVEICLELRQKGLDV